MKQLIGQSKEYKGDLDANFSILMQNFKNAMEQKASLKRSKKKCCICYEQFEKEDYYTLGDCKHRYHKKCLTEYANKGLEEGKPMVCLKCKKRINPLELEELLKPEEEKVKGNFICTAKNCGFTTNLEELKNIIASEKFFCVKCGQDYCATCRTVYHNGMNCYTNQIRFQQSPKKGHRLVILNNYRISEKILTKIIPPNSI